jgi:outer membrane immunogenic protein
MLRRLAIAVVLCGYFTPALAQDAAPNRWSGFYIGAHGGGGEGRLQGATQDLQGTIAGGHAGYNWQGPNVVLGIEADLSWTDYELALKTNVGAFSVGASASHDFFTSARARLGFADGPIMVYGTFGVAYTEIDTVLSISGPGINIVDKETTELGGIIGGLGFEYALGSNLALRGEALWFDVRPDFDFTDSGYDGYEVRAGLSYYFK